jgi:hypothetical protein
MNPNNPEAKDNLPGSIKVKASDKDTAGLTRKDGVNAFLANQDEKNRPEDILYSEPDDIDNAEDIISG